MFSNGQKYFRQVAAPVRTGLITRGSTLYEVMSGAGVTRVVTFSQLGEAVGYGPQNSRKDFQECQSAAHRLFAAGRRDEWVHYSSSFVYPSKYFQSAEQVATPSGDNPPA